jgi:4-hydroxy-tetrahydrodipicolinate reductase
VRIALVGYGRMGRAVEGVAGERGHEVTVRVDGPGELASALATDPPLGGARTAIEFTTGEAAPGVIMGLAGAGIAVVSGTTGWAGRREEVEATVREHAGKGAALLHAPNFSLGVQLFLRVARAAARLANRMEELDLHVLEVHHRHKADHPGGTARLLAELVLDEVARKRSWAEGAPVGPADPGVLQVDAVRVGENPGTHILGIEGPDDRLELRHEARGRGGFARGAVLAAEWLEGRTGVRSVEEWLDDRFSSRDGG